MKKLMEDCLEFLLKTAAGVFILAVLIVLVALAIFWPAVETEPLPWLGIVGKDIDSKVIQQYHLPFNNGVLVERVFANSPADRSNLAPGDSIVKFNNRIVFTEAELRDLIFDMDPEEKAWMTVYRDGSYYNVMLRLATRPTDNAVPAQAAALLAAAGGPTTPTRGPKTDQLTANAAPPITANAGLPHTYRGVCSNCHVIVSSSQTNQPNTQLVAAQVPTPQMSAGPRNGPLPVQNIPGAVGPTPLEEFTWAGVSMETFNPANAAALGLAPNVTGVQVDDVLLGSRGDRAGLKARDLIREINGFAVYDVDLFANTVTTQNLTGGVLLINRAGKSMYVTVPEA